MSTTEASIRSRVTQLIFWLTVLAMAGLCCKAIWLAIFAGGLSMNLLPLAVFTVSASPFAWVTRKKAFY